MLWAALAVYVGLAAPLDATASVQGDLIVNKATFLQNGVPQTSATVTVTVVVRTTSKVEFLQYGASPDGNVAPGATLTSIDPTFYRSASDPGALFAQEPKPVPSGFTAPIDLGKPVPLVPADAFHAGEPIFVRVTDPDQNQDRTSRETILVTVTNSTTGDTEVLRLVETGPDTGVFVGYLATSAAGNSGGVPSYSGTLVVSQGDSISAHYTDVADGSDTSAAAVVVDPLGIVFDSSTGSPLDGATVTLFDINANKPATVYGDNGTAIFPATVVTGAVVKDSSGRAYAFPPGGFRFPFITPGKYQLRVTPPSGYVTPSVVPDAVIGKLAGGVFRITAGSRGETFLVDPGPVLRIDIPADPKSTKLWIQKSAGKTQVAVGDIVPYQISVQNNDALGAASLAITDRLPQGFRYRKGSTRVGELPAADPAISADGRTLTFNIGALAAKATVSMQYVVEISAGTPLGTSINMAQATSGPATSNVATAQVEVRSDFLSSRSLIMGRVYNGSCSEDSSTPDKGVAGVRIYLEDGTFVDTDKNGMYHFEGVTPRAHVVQLDLDSLPAGYSAVPCEKNSRFAGRAYSQFVELQGGTMWRADFHLARAGARSQAGEHVALPGNAAGEEGEGSVEADAPESAKGAAVGIDLQSALKGGREINYQVRVWGAEPITGKRVDVTLPPGVSYLSGSSNLNGAAVADPAGNGSRLSFPLTDSEGEWIDILRFRAALAPDAAAGDLATTSQLDFLTPAGTPAQTPVAENVLATVRSESSMAMPDLVLHPHFRTLGVELSDQDRAALDEVARMLKVLDIRKITISGHTDNVKIAPHNRCIYRDNRALSAARAQSVGRYLKEKLHLPPEKMEYLGYGESRPVASNDSAAGRAENRRVEIRVQTTRVVEKNELELKKGQSGMQQVAVAGKPAAKPAGTVMPAKQETEVAPQEKPQDAPEAKQGSAEGEPQEAQQSAVKDEPGVLNLSNGSILIYPINGVRVCLPTALTPKLTVDGREVPADRIGFTMKDPKSNKSLYSYIGVDFGAQGEHTLQLSGIDPFGNARFNQSIKVIRSGAVAALRVRSAEGNLADGKTPVKLQLELLDGSGNRIAAAAELEIKEGELKPYKPGAVSTETTAGQAERVQVDAQGNVLFQPVSRSGLYRVTLGLNGVKLEAETYVKPLLRDWILVGIAEGTAGYNAISGHLQSLEGSGLDERLYEDDRLAFYAKGTIKGEWLLTASYDSAKSTGATGNGLFQTIDPNTYYTLYGDASKQQYDAASIKKLYLKIERDQFYALFGDFDTGLTVTELSRYSRRLNGVKMELHGKKVEVNAFGSEAGQAYVRDEIQGDGTSGLYHLSRRGIVINSDKITIEVRDRFRSEILVSTRVLNRFTDYSIDYDSGTLLFKEPIYNRDDQFNPIFIVAQYETQQSSSAITAGGRAGVKLLDEKVKGGVTYIHEGQANGSGDSIGVDATVQLGQGTTLKGEAAHSASNLGTRTSGNAYLAELTRKTGQLESRVYYREIDTGFGLGQQQGSEVGTRKMGADAIYKVNEAVTVNGQAKREYNLSTGAQRDMVEAKANYNAGNYGATLGARYANDNLGDGTNKTSTQLSMGANWLTLDKKLNLRVSHDQSIGPGANVDYPTRTILGADYKLTEQVSAFAQQEFTEGSSSRANTTRAGFKTTPWQGGALNSSVERNVTEDQDRIFALFGLKQTWKLTERWTVDAGIDRSQTIKESYVFNVNTPPASGSNAGSSEDFTAVSAGADYRRIDWSWNGRVEVRSAKSEDKWGVMSSLLGEPMEGWGWSARLQMFHTDSSAQQNLHGDLRFGLVHRPLQSKWIILDRLDLLIDHLQGSGATNTNDRRIVNNLSANYRPSRRTQVSLQYGAKYVLQSVDSTGFSGYTDLIGVEGRYDVTEKWDLGAKGSLLHSWSTGQLMNSCGLSLGYNVVENAWLSVGYNLTGFHDRDFSAANYTAQGPYLKFRFKFDQHSVKEAIKSLNQ